MVLEMRFVEIPVEENSSTPEQVLLAVKTLHLRIKDKHANVLVAMAKEVNQVWNYLNELSHRSIVERHKWLSGYDFHRYTVGYTKCEGVKIGAATVQQINEEYAIRRNQFRKTRLNWRVSNPKSAKYSLGWIPFRQKTLSYKNGQVKFRGLKLSLWDSYNLSQYELRSGSFNQDSKGRWYLNVAVHVKTKASIGTASIGIDLGLKECAVTSDDQRIEGRFYRKSEAKLGTAQRACKKRQVKTIHAKIKNQRKDLLHKFSTKLVVENAAIFVGNVSSAKLVKTKMAKSTLDAGWSMFKTMLLYKSSYAGIVFAEVNESYTTQACSQCGSIEGPKGLSGLRIREWTCSSCGAAHDRDTNAARNILRIGHDTLAVGASAS